jgi:peptidoglycan/LPS O-acetylase OafA/YrhL
VIGRALSWGPLERAGQFSYSTYLIHGPVMLAIFSAGIVCGFWTALAVVIPSVYVASYLFFLAFERPFLSVRTWRDLRLPEQPRSIALTRNAPSKGGRI